MKRQAKRLWVLLLCLCMALTMTAVPAAGADGSAVGTTAQAGETGANSLGTQTAETRKTAQTALLTGSEGGQPTVLNENGGGDNAQQYSNGYHRGRFEGCDSRYGKYRGQTNK